MFLCSLICVAESHSILSVGLGDKSRSLSSAFSRRSLYLIIFCLQLVSIMFSCSPMSRIMGELGSFMRSLKSVWRRDSS